LLEMAEGQETSSGYENERTEIFRDFGEDRDGELTETLEGKLKRCRSSEQREQARLAVEHAKQTAEGFSKDFGRLDGV
jgi:hypothetical protein